MKKTSFTITTNDEKDKAMISVYRAKVKAEKKNFQNSILQLIEEYVTTHRPITRDMITFPETLVTEMENDIIKTGASADAIESLIKNHFSDLEFEGSVTGKINLEKEMGLLKELIERMKIISMSSISAMATIQMVRRNDKKKEEVEHVSPIRLAEDSTK